MSVVKSDLIKQLADNYPNFIKKDLIRLFEIVVNEIQDALKRGERIELRDVFAIEPRVQKARVSRNPKTNEKVNTKTNFAWLSDLVELLESGENPEHYYEYTKLQLYDDQVFCFTPKGAIIRLPKQASPIDFAYAVHTEIGDSCIGCRINGKDSPLETYLMNGDSVEIIRSKKISPSYHWLSYAKTGKARAAIRRYWQDKLPANRDKKIHKSSIWLLLSHKAGTLGEIATLIGKHNCNIYNLELVDKKEDYLSFIFDVEIKNLKDFTNLISDLKTKSINFKIIRNRKVNDLRN